MDKKDVNISVNGAELETDVLKPEDVFETLKSTGIPVEKSVLKPAALTVNATDNNADFSVNEKTDASFSIKSNLDSDKFELLNNAWISRHPNIINSEKAQGFFEVLPPFSIHTKDGVKIDVPPIPMKDLWKANQRNKEERKADGTLEKDYLKDVFEKYIHQNPNAPENVDFAIQALKRFFSEYTFLDTDNIQMSSMVRAAIQNGITFDFYESNMMPDKKHPDQMTERFSTKTLAQYSTGRHSIEFNCNAYPKGYAEHKTLAHELGHYAARDTDKGFGTFVESDFGRMWYEQLKTEAFLGDTNWKQDDSSQTPTTMEKWIEKNGYSPQFWPNLNKQMDNIILGKNYKTDEAKVSEMFARVAGLLCGESKKMNAVPKSIRSGVQLVLDMAKAKASGNEKWYNAIVSTLKEYKLENKDFLKKVKKARNIQTDILTEVMNNQRHCTDEMLKEEDVEKLKKISEKYKKKEKQIYTDSKRSDLSKACSDMRVMVLGEYKKIMDEINKKRGSAEQIKKENEDADKIALLYKDFAQYARKGKSLDAKKSRTLIKNLIKMQEKPFEKSKIKLDEKTAGVFLTVKSKSKD